MRSSVVRRSTVMTALAAMLVAGLATAAPVGAEPVDVGYGGPSFSASGVSAPTGQKPQSKLWHDDGSWWGALFSVDEDAYTIHRLDWSSQTWTDTGVVIDPRNSARIDMLWTGSRLFALSAGTNPDNPGHDLQVRAYDYDAGTGMYTLDQASPVVLEDGGMEAAVFDIDDNGVLWATWTRESSVYVTRTGASDLDWVAPFVLPVDGADNVSADDIAAVVDVDGGIGVMWSNENDEAFYWAEHADGTPDDQWSQAPALQGPGYADDHINLASLRSDPAGRVFAVVKTSLDAPDAPLVLLLVQDGTGGWQRYTITTKQYEPTRPIVVLDDDNRAAFVFASAPCCSGGTIYRKQTSIDDINFPSGNGTPAIQSSSDSKINNVTSTKQNVNSTTGLVILAGDDDSKRYLYNAFDLSTLDVTAPETTITSGPEGTVTTATATFEFTSDEPSTSTYACSLDGAVPSDCTSPITYEGLADGEHIFEVAATDEAGNVDTTPATRTWTVDLSSAATFTYAAEADSTIDESAPTDNFGSDDQLDVDGGSADQQALVRFEVTGLDGNVERAALRLYAFNGTPDGPEVLGTDGGWDESTVTWESRPATGALLADAASVASDAWLEFNVTSAVTADGTYSFVLEPDSSDAARFHSREASSLQPELVVTTDAEGDTEPPETTITEAPPATAVTRDATFEFTSTETDSTFACSLDGAPASACTSPTTYEDLADGEHTFEVSATDASGNTDPTPATHTWTVDPSAAKTLTYAAGADTTIDESAPTTNFGSDDQLDVDGGRTDQQALLRFTVGGLSGTLEAATLRLFAFNPTSDGPVVSTAGDEWDEDTVTWDTRPATGAALDDAGAVARDEWLELDVAGAVTGEGTYAFVLTPDSSDAARFWSREAADLQPELVLTVGGNSEDDVDPPETTITAAPPATAATRSATFEFVSDEAGSTFACALDGSTPTACVSPITYDDLADGDHTFEVAATDPAGNTDTTPATHTWTVDLSSSETVFVFDAQADATVDEERPDSNFGSDTTLETDAGDKRQKHTYLRFEVTGLTAPVVSASLRTHATNGSWNAPAVQEADNTWDESTITWDNRPAASGPVLDDLGGVNAGEWAEWDVTVAVAGDGTYTLLLTTESTDALKVDSREASSDMPQLVVRVEESG